jgi:hypothetical protein
VGPGHAGEDTGFDAMDEGARFTLRGHETIPTTCDVPWRLQAEYAIGERIACVMIEEKPTVESGVAEGGLKGG